MLSEEYCCSFPFGDYASRVEREQHQHIRLRQSFSALSTCWVQVVALKSLRRYAEVQGSALLSRELGRLSSSTEYDRDSSGYLVNDIIKDQLLTVYVCGCVFPGRAPYQTEVLHLHRFVPQTGFGFLMQAILLGTSHLLWFSLLLAGVARNSVFSWFYTAILLVPVAKMMYKGRCNCEYIFF